MLTGNRFAHASAVVLAMSLWGVLPASAQIFVYTNPAAYQAAQFPDDVIQFDGLVANPSSVTNLGVGGTLNVGGVTFTTAGPFPTDLSVVGPQSNPPLSNIPGDGTATLDAASNGSNPAFLGAILPSNLPVGVTAVGTEFADLTAPNTITITLTLADSSTDTYSYNVPPAQPGGLSFVGFVSLGQPIASLSIYDNPTLVQPDDLVIDNFTYGSVNPAAVPEPSSLSLIALGTAALFFVRRRLASR